MYIKVEFALMQKGPDGRYSKQLGNKELPDFYLTQINVLVGVHFVELLWNEASLSFQPDGTIIFSADDAFEMDGKRLAARTFLQTHYIQSILCNCEETGEILGHISGQGNKLATKLQLRTLMFSDNGSEWFNCHREAIEEFNNGEIDWLPTVAIAAEVKDYLRFCKNTSKVYPFAVSVFDVTEEQLKQIAKYATWPDTEVMYEGACKILGLNPCLAAPSKEYRRCILNKEALEKIRELAKDFYMGADRYMRELEDSSQFINPVEEILEMVLGNLEAAKLGIIQEVREHLFDEEYLNDCFGGYQYGIPAEKVTEDQIEQIAELAGCRKTDAIHRAALTVLGKKPVIQMPEEEPKEKQYKLVLTCYDFHKPEPYTEELPHRYETPEKAKLSMQTLVLDELVSLNGIDANGNFPERRFIATTEDSDHDIVINAWDGPDYRPVTCYDIVEV